MMRVVYSGPRQDCTAIRDRIRELSGCGAETVKSAGKHWLVQVPNEDYRTAYDLVWGDNPEIE